MLRSVIVIIACYCCSYCSAQGTTGDDPCITFEFSEMVGQAGDTVCSQLKVVDFVNVLSFQFSARYDDTVLDYMNCIDGELIKSFKCGDVRLQRDEPVLKTLWFEPLGKLTTLDSAAVIMNLCFNVKADLSEGITYLAFTDDLKSEVTVGDPNDLSVADRLEFCPTADFTSSIKSISTSPNLSIFPNPAQSTLFIQNSDTEHFPVLLTLYNLTGQIVQTHRINPYQPSLPLHELNPGHYVIRIDMNEGESYSMPLIKM